MLRFIPWAMTATLLVACAHATPPPLEGTAWQLVRVQSMDDSQGSTTVPDPALYKPSFGRWLGVPSDPLAGLPALLVGLPWTALAGLLPDAGQPWMPMRLLVGSVMLDALLVWWLARRRAAPKEPGR